MVVDTTHLSVRNTCLRTVVVALGALGHFDTTALAVATEIGLTGRVDEVNAVDVHEVIVETHGQRIGLGHEATLAVGLHRVFLAADVDHDLAGLGCIDIEIGATLLVDLRELVAGDGVLDGDGVGGHHDLRGYLHLRPPGFEAQVTGDGLAIAAAQLTVAGSVKVQTVRTVGAVVGRDDLRGVDGLGQRVYLLLTAVADALATGLHDIAGIEVHLLGFQLQVATEVLIHPLHHAGPLRVAGIGLALVHQDALDDAVLLGLLGQRDQTLVGVVAVGFEHALHPAGRFLLGILLDAVGQETLDVDTANGNVDDTNLDVLRQRGHQRTAKPVGGRQACAGTAEGWYGLAPFAHLAGGIVVGSGVVNGRHQQETRSGTLQVLSLRTGCTLHVRLSETKEDVEIRVDSSGCALYTQQRKGCNSQGF